VALALKMVCVQARKTRLTSITEGIVDIGWAKLSLLMATFVAGILLGVFCTVFCFMRWGGDKTHSPLRQARLHGANILTSIVENM